MHAPLSETATLPAPSWMRGIGLRQIRMASGAVLFAYVLSHFLNHALGNISADALARGVAVHKAIWQFLPITVLFYGSVAVHGVLGIWAVYERREFRYAAMEPLQLLLGLSLPLLIVVHVVGMRLAQELYGHEKLYPQVFYAYWVASPLNGWLALVAMLTAWVHGCVGLYLWLRLRDGFPRIAPVLLAVAVLLPALAFLGLYQGGRTVVDQSRSTTWQAENLSRAKIGDAAETASLDTIADGIILGYLGLVMLALAGRGLRTLAAQRKGTVLLSYGEGPPVRSPKGLSVLEASLRHRIPHASVCGGRARCSTCRIRIFGDCAKLPPPSPREAYVLSRVGAAGDPSIRLACQLRPTSDLVFQRLFPPGTKAEDLGRLTPRRAGQERYLVSLFVDMRGSTRLAENRLPFDTVFIVNRFLGAVSRAVVACGGAPNQFVGDGQLALFGLDTEPATACRQALHAAAAIADNVADLNLALAHDLPEPIRFGIGIHAGDVIVGDIGYREHMAFTALGDSVNVAARLQDMTKSLGCELILSDEVRQVAGLDEASLACVQLDIRGRIGGMKAHPVTRCLDLRPLLPGLRA